MTNLMSRVTLFNCTKCGAGKKQGLVHKDRMIIEKDGVNIYYRCPTCNSTVMVEIIGLYNSEGVE